MNRLWTAALLSTLCTSLFQVAANAATFSFSNPLSGSQQTPPNASPATGFATSVLAGEPDRWSFSYNLTFSGLSGPLALAHIHLAPVGQAGPVVHDLDAPPLGDTSGQIVGDWTSTEVVALGVDPSVVFSRFLDGQYYFNVHSDTPGTNFRAAGEIRGQIQDPIVAESVPEPSAVLSLLALSAFGARSVLKRAEKDSQKSTSLTA
jgi:CHRD domain